MNPTGKNLLKAIARSVVIASLLLTAPIPIAWYGTKEAERKLAAGDPGGAERLLSWIGAFSTYPLLPRLAEARIHGVRCELSAQRGLDRDAMDHFVKELSILVGREVNSGSAVVQDGRPPVLSPLRFRDGVEAWSRGYAEWRKSAPEAMPDFDRDFLAPVREIRPEVGESGPPLDPRYVESLRDLFNRVRKGEGAEEIVAYLERHAHELERARQWSDGTEAVGIEEATDGFRILFLDFAGSCQTHNEAEALKAFARCGRMLRQLEARPSMAALLVNHALRSQWIASVETLLGARSLPPSTRQGLARDLTRYRSDPEFPPLCFRYEYASSRSIYVDSYLEGGWDKASAAGRRLFVRQLELDFALYQALAAAVSPGADPGVSGRTFHELHEATKLSPKVLDLRRRFAKSLYGSGALTEADGRDLAAAVDDWVALYNAAAAVPRLGRLDDSLRELHESEDRLIGKLESGP